MCIEAGRLRALIVGLPLSKLARRDCITRVHRVEAGLRHGKAVTLVLIARLLISALAVPRVCEYPMGCDRRPGWHGRWQCHG
jgi:hypothetical protein